MRSSIVSKLLYNLAEPLPVLTMVTQLTTNISAAVTSDPAPSSRPSRSSLLTRPERPLLAVSLFTVYRERVIDNFLQFLSKATKYFVKFSEIRIYYLTKHESNLRTISPSDILFERQ